MILYLMKNNFKLMMRNKLAIIVLLIGPLLCIAMLSTSFNSLMQSYEAPDKFTVGYRETDSFLSGSMDTVKEAGREAGIVFSEYPEGDPSELIANNSLSAFIEFGSSDYRLYKSSDHKPEGAVTEYFLERVMSKSADAVLDTMSPGGKMTSALDVTELEYMPAVNSTDYYGIIYIVFFFFCGMICNGRTQQRKKERYREKVSGMLAVIGKALPRKTYPRGRCHARMPYHRDNRDNSHVRYTLGVSCDIRADPRANYNSGSFLRVHDVQHITQPCYNRNKPVHGILGNGIHRRQL